VSGALDAWPVGTAVGNVRNNGPSWCRPVALHTQSELGSV
jgi:hypothetical protein